MNEQVDVAQTGDESSEPTAARTADIGPSISASYRDCRCRLLVKLRVERMRRSMLQRCPVPLRDMASRITRLVTPRATPVSSTFSGRR